MIVSEKLIRCALALVIGNLVAIAVLAGLVLIRQDDITEIQRSQQVTRVESADQRCVTTGNQSLFADQVVQLLERARVPADDARDLRTSARRFGNDTSQCHSIRDRYLRALDDAQKREYRNRRQEASP